MTVDITRFCGSCGAPRESTALRFCRRCGAAFAAAMAVEPAPPFLIEARCRPPGLVGLLALFGSATYAFFWLWMSWREVKRIRRDATMRPFWHAVAVFAFPLYGLFRFHAHFRTIDGLLAREHVRVRAGAGLLTLVFVLLLGILYGGLALSAAAAAASGSAGLRPLSLVVVGGAYAYVVVTGQRALSAYYRSLGSDIPQRGHAFEYIFIVLFALAFLIQLSLAMGARP